MKAIEYTEYGPPEVLRITDIAKPVPKDNEVLIRVRATTVGYGDTIARNFRNVSPGEFHMPLLFWLIARVSFGLRRPRSGILGSEFSGSVESVGKNVTSFAAGDQVFGYLGQRMGAYAEYLCMPERGTLAHKPANLTFEQAAVLPYGAIMALHLLTKTGIRQGQKVLINGASGSIGSAAVQIARHFGAEVTGVCGTPRVEFVESLGADRVIDYTRDDFTRTGETYDLIVDVLGTRPFSQCRRALKDNGTCLYVSFKTKQLLQMLWTSLTRGQKGRRVLCALAPGSREDLLAVRELAEAGTMKVVIDRTFPLERVAEAHRYIEEGRKKGHVVITLEDLP